MAEIPPVGPGLVGPIDRVVQVAAYYRTAETLRPQSEPLADRVELSRHAMLLDRLRQLPDVRTDLIQAVRAAIADGTYETDEKLCAAVDGLLRELG